MGKRQIGELQVSEFIISVILSEIAAFPITNPAVPLLHAVIPILLLLSVEVIVSYILLKNNFLKRLFYGKPSIIIRKGKLVQKELKKNRIEIDELMSELRQKGFSDPADVYYAVLEENGKLSVFPRAEKSPVTPSDLEHHVIERGMAHVCVVDGQIIEQNLALCSYDKTLLIAEIRKRGLTLADIFLLTIDDCGSITVIIRDKTVL